MTELFPSIGLLIPDLREGNEMAWNSLCEDFRPGLESRTRAMLRHSQINRTFGAEDMVQDTFSRAWQKRASFKGATTAQFAKWLLTILRNLIIDRHRQLPPECSVLTWVGFSEDVSSPSNHLLSLEQEASIQACLIDLDEKYRLILTLRHFEGLKFAEMAEQTGQTTGAVAGLYRRGLAELVELMERRGLRTDFL